LNHLYITDIFSINFLGTCAAKDSGRSITTSNKD
jgi:hypothetical protein